MQMYEVTNGCVGFGVVRCYVVGNDYNHCYELAKESFMQDDDRESYYRNLELKLLCDDISNGFASEVSD